MIELEFTKTARDKILQFMEKQGGVEKNSLRVTIPSTNPQGFNYQFFLEESQAAKEQDTKVDCQGFYAILDPGTLSKMDGALIDWVEGVSGSGFKVENPNRPAVDLDIPIEERIQQILDQEINPSLDAHGGMVSLIEVKGPRAYVRMSGGCQGCASSQATLKQGVEVRIKEIAPEILEVIDTTDHAAGTNPYFQG